MNLAAHTHLLMPYYRPRSMGGDVAQPLCLKPNLGWAGEEAAAYPMSDDHEEVSCPFCLGLMKPGVRKDDEPAPYLIPVPRKNRHDLHLRAIWEASGGMMFPYGVEQRKAA